ncbi:MAG: tRNA guanosine(34) transglycosylase Tgt [Zetaproteobacteria bacterium]|nr:MAG: tRNA guanosine(34) transglycosylase Tgt [Zetaproteobacteria bacterium]
MRSMAACAAMSALKFELLARAKGSFARCGRMHLPHGLVETPVFMPVGTQATVKAMTPRDLEEIGAQIILGNTYHLMLRPGAELIEQIGGLHRFMAWNGPILTDSGGFQVWSLGDLRKIEAHGVRFRSHINGDEVFLGPKESMDIQRQLGSDIVMTFDECTPYPATEDEARASMELSMRWARECREHLPPNPEQALFGIVQGGMYPGLRLESLQQLSDIGFEGIAIGGLSVGEPKEDMFSMLDALASHLPEDKPHYLMGVGTPADLIEGIDRGIDMFDCVMPTRNARNGTLFTDSGTIHIKQARFRDDSRPLMENCKCYACQHFSRAYLRHLYVSREILSSRLNTVHNLHYYCALMRRARTSIEAGQWPEFRDQFLHSYHGNQDISGDT